MPTLRPAQDIYHRLRWGGDVALADVEIEIRDRRDVDQRIPFADFDPEGPIPFSRILAFRLGGRVIWDRARRIDRVLGSGLTPGERISPREGPAPPVAPDGGMGPRSLRVLTWNVLFDRYDQEIVRTRERIPRLLELLWKADADLVGLQEVEAPLLRTLLEVPWITGQYQLTDGPEAATVQPYGQVLLSRLPIRASAVHMLGEDKRHLVADVELGPELLRVAVVHLSSDRHADARERRARQVERLRGLLGDAPRVLLLGDVNQDEPLDLPLRDVWREARPDDRGYTWDPEVNALARAVTRSGRRRRLDRVLVRGLRPRAARLWGVDPGPLPPSDHHGIVADLEVPASIGPDQPVAALVVPVPPALAAEWEPLRRRLDPNRWRWRAHLTLWHGPVDRAALTAYLPRAAEALREQPPFAVLLDRLDRFTQRGAGQWLAVACPDPAGDAALKALRASLQGGPWAEPDPLPAFRPHVTLARIALDADVERAAVEAALQRHLPRALAIDRVQLWARDGAGPMEVRESIALGAPAAGVPGWSGLGDQLRLAGIAPRAPRAGWAGPPPAGEAAVVGAWALGAALPESDLRLVVREDDPPGARLRWQAAVGGRLVDREGPRLVFTTQDEGLPRGVRALFLAPGVPGPEPALAASAADHPRFVPALQALLAWAAARQVGAAAWGFPGERAWAAAAAAAGPPEDDTPEGWLLHLWERLLGPDGGASRASLPAVADLVRGELERALLLGWDGAWRRVLAAALPPGEGVPAMVVDLRAEAAADREALYGWLCGQAAAWVSRLAADGGEVRPWPRPQHRRGGLRIRVSVPGTPEATIRAAAAALQAHWRAWRAKPAGADLRLFWDAADGTREASF